jgi:hypothetical protein
MTVVTASKANFYLERSKLSSTIVDLDAGDSHAKATQMRNTTDHVCSRPSRPPLKLISSSDIRLTPTVHAQKSIPKSMLRQCREA